MNEEYKRSVREGQSRPELALAEARVRAALEEELQHLAIQSDEGIAESVLQFGKCPEEKDT